MQLSVNQRVIHGIKIHKNTLYTIRIFRMFSGVFLQLKTIGRMRLLALVLHAKNE